ncbi:MAG: hypothetical protein V2A54_08740 [Bacteroidota bacterium]
MVKVTVIDKTTNAPIENAHVFLISETSSGFLGPTYSNIMEEKQTDKIGQCTFDFTAYSHYSYYCVSSAEHYYKQEEERGSVVKGCMNYVALAMQPEAYLKVYVKNTQPYNIYDEILVGSFGTPSGGGGYYQGVNVDTFSIARLWGGITRELFYQVTKNNITNNYNIPVYCTTFDTTVYTINY